MADTAYIMMGLPGSGKTTLLKDYASSAVVCSADHYFIQSDGKYVFNGKHLGHAHALCLNLFLHTCRDGVDVACDNTNTQLIHIAPYIAIAQASGYDVKVIHVESPSALDRQLHGVPKARWIRMRKELEETLSQWPNHWPVPKRIST